MRKYIVHREHTQSVSTSQIYLSLRFPSFPKTNQEIFAPQFQLSLFHPRSIHSLIALSIFLISLSSAPATSLCFLMLSFTTLSNAQLISLSSPLPPPLFRSIKPILNIHISPLMTLGYSYATCRMLFASRKHLFQLTPSYTCCQNFSKVVKKCTPKITPTYRPKMRVYTMIYA